MTVDVVIGQHTHRGQLLKIHIRHALQRSDQITIRQLCCLSSLTRVPLHLPLRRKLQILADGTHEIAPVHVVDTVLVRTHAVHRMLWKGSLPVSLHACVMLLHRLLLHQELELLLLCRSHIGEI